MYNNKQVVLLLFQEGETPVHYAAEIKKTQAHHEFEDTDMIQLILKYGGDTNISTKLVRGVRLFYMWEVSQSM